MIAAHVIGKSNTCGLFSKEVIAANQLLSFPRGLELPQRWFSAMPLYFSEFELADTRALSVR